MTVIALVAAPVEIDLSTVAGFRAELRETILEHRGATVWVDLSEVTFLDSVGLGVLVGQRKFALGWGGDLLLVAPSPVVVRALELTELGRMLPIELRTPSTGARWSTSAP